MAHSEKVMSPLSRECDREGWRYGATHPNIRR